VTIKKGGGGAKGDTKGVSCPQVPMELFYHVTIQSHMWFLRRYVEFKKYSNIRNNIENYSSLVSFLKMKFEK